MPEINTTWVDYSGNSNHGTIHGATFQNRGRYGDVLLFDGINDYVSMADTPELDLSEDPGLSLCAWMQVSDSNTNHLIVRLDPTDNIEYSLSIMATDKPQALIKNGLGTVQVTISSEILTHDKWYFIVGTADTAIVKIYVNAVLRGTKPVVAGLGSTDGTELRIGRGPAPFFKGLIDEVLIFNRRINPWEIRDLYEQGKPEGT